MPAFRRPPSVGSICTLWGSLRYRIRERGGSSFQLQDHPEQRKDTRTKTRKPLPPGACDPPDSVARSSLRKRLLAKALHEKCVTSSSPQNAAASRKYAGLPIGNEPQHQVSVQLLKCLSHCRPLSDVKPVSSRPRACHRLLPWLVREPFLPPVSTNAVQGCKKRAKIPAECRAPASAKLQERCRPATIVEPAGGQVPASLMRGGYCHAGAWQDVVQNRRVTTGRPLGTRLERSLWTNGG